MKKTVYLYFIISLLTWLSLSMNFRMENLIIGLIASFITAYVFGNMFTNIPIHIKLSTIYWMSIFVLQVLFDLMMSVALSSYRVFLSPKTAEKLSRNIAVNISLKSRFGENLLSNAVSLSPLMLSTDFDRETGLLHINCFSDAPDIQEKAVKIVSKYEKILLKFLK